MFVEAIADLAPSVIIFDNRFRDWDFKTQCLITVDGVDCPIKEQYPFDKEIFSHKLNGPGYKYEVGVSISRADIVWINGLFKAGRGDQTIFIEDGLSDILCDDEYAEVDGGYNGSDKMKGPTVAKSRSDRKQKSVARGRHENVNRRLKCFSILDNVFRGPTGRPVTETTSATGKNEPEKHQWAFATVAVIIQLGFELDGGLYPVEYNVKYDY